MHCANCGTRLPAEANFCRQCSLAQRPGLRHARRRVLVGATLTGLGWESCQIEIRPAEGVDEGYQFVVEATKPSGKYLAAVSEVFKYGRLDDPHADWNLLPKAVIQHHLEPLVKKLLEDRWRSTGSHGDYWYSLKFRRLVG